MQATIQLLKMLREDVVDFTGPKDRVTTPTGDGHTQVTFGSDEVDALNQPVKADNFALHKLPEVGSRASEVLKSMTVLAHTLSQLSKSDSKSLEKSFEHIQGLRDSLTELDTFLASYQTEVANTASETGNV